MLLFRVSANSGSKCYMVPVNQSEWLSSLLMDWAWEVHIENRSAHVWRQQLVTFKKTNGPKSLHTSQRANVQCNPLGHALQ